MLWIVEAGSGAELAPLEGRYPLGHSGHSAFLRVSEPLVGEELVAKQMLCIAVITSRSTLLVHSQPWPAVWRTLPTKQHAAASFSCSLGVGAPSPLS